MTTYNDSLSLYITSLYAQEDDALRHVPASSLSQGLPEISIKPEEGRFLQTMVLACSAKKALEIGALGGYSGIWIARGLQEGGRLISLELDPHHAEVTRRHLAEAGMQDRVEVRLGNAHDLLPGLAQDGPFDFIFIDADKSSYIAYFDWAVLHTRPGSIIAVHNAFWHGAVTRQGDVDDETRTIQHLNRYAAAHPAVRSTIYPAGDGTLICVRI